MKLLLTGFGIAAAVILALAVFKDGKPKPDEVVYKTGEQVAAESAAAESKGSPRLALGETGVLSAMGGGMALLSTTKDGYDDISRAMRAHDQVGLTEMVTQGQAFIGAKGSKVLVLENSFLMARVRIQSGKNTGLAGWVPFEFVTK